jgi:hypothetical protein
MHRGMKAGVSNVAERPEAYITSCPSFLPKADVTQVAHGEVA